MFYFLQCHPQQRVNVFQCISRFSFQLDHGRWKDFFQGRGDSGFFQVVTKTFFQGVQPWGNSVLPTESEQKKFFYIKK